tara:strand:+ start:106 stop:477 length:372 start_codon:yes stop_codon:yes gene_type:complete
MLTTTTPETLLLVDPDPLQRAVVADYLRGCGYRVIEATTAHEAVTALTDQEVAVVVTDIHLRDASGFELSAKAKEIRPGVAVVLTHAPERTAKLAGDLCEDGPLDHPYHPQLLVDRIKRLRRS